MGPGVFCEGGSEGEVATEGAADAVEGVMSEGGGAEGLGEVVSVEAWGDGVVVRGLGGQVDGGGCRWWFDAWRAVLGGGVGVRCGWYAESIGAGRHFIGCRCGLTFVSSNGGLTRLWVMSHRDCV